MSYADGFDAPYYLGCGCFSEWADHRCGPMFDRCRGCGVPDDCMCHESCEPGHACYICEADYRATRDSDHGDALDALSLAPVLRAGEVPGDSMYAPTVTALPWWWDRPESWEFQRFAAGHPVRY